MQAGPAGVFLEEKSHTYVRPHLRLGGIRPITTWDRGEKVQDHWPIAIVLICSVRVRIPPTLSFTGRPDQPALENVVLATTDANGGEYDLISSTVIGRGYYSKIKREIPAILADGGISLR